MEAEAVTGAPDLCPFSRAFSAEFDSCDAFEAVPFQPVDTMYRPLRPVLTCRHLDVGTRASGGHYPRCVLGDRAGRTEWLKEVGSGTLAGLRELSQEYRIWVGGLMPAVSARKAAVQAAQREGRIDLAAHAELRAATETLIAQAHAWIDGRAERMLALGLPPAAVKELVTVATKAWAQSLRAGSSYRVPDELLDRFPESVRAFIRAGR
jgi:hypothetical protein